MSDLVKMTEQDRIRLAEAMGWTANFTEYEYQWAVNQRKGLGDADNLLDDPEWENVEDAFFRDNYTDNYCFRRKLPEPVQDGWLNPEGRKRSSIPDPENDANDDYAVLEWMRAKYDGDMKATRESHAVHAVIESPITYRVGDYARAALDALDNG